VARSHVRRLRDHAPAPALLLALASLAAAGPAQVDLDGPPSIEELVRAYRDGRHEQTVSRVIAWGPERMALEVGRLLDRERPADGVDDREATRLAAAAILAESAVVHAREGDPARVDPALSTARRLLEAEPLGESALPFARRFYLLAGLVLHWHVEIAAGHELLHEALERFPDDPELLTAAGSLVETVASLRDYEQPGGSAQPGGSGGGYRSEIGGRGGALPGASLARAEARYRRALALGPGLDEARLRLAHVRVLDGRAGDALDDLERVAAETRETRLRYLARLFEGRAREALGDAEGAAAAYRACTAQLPHAQSGLLALGRALERLGDTGGAQAAFAGIGAAGNRFDPWWSYQAGQPQRIDELLAELRALAR